MQVKFTTFGSNSAFGSFGPGDTMRCSPEMAKHLVDDVKCAKYIEAPKVEEKKVEFEPEVVQTTPKYNKRKAK